MPNRHRSYTAAVAAMAGVAVLTASVVAVAAAEDVGRDGLLARAAAATDMPEASPEEARSGLSPTRTATTDAPAMRRLDVDRGPAARAWQDWPTTRDATREARDLEQRTSDALQQARAAEAHRIAEERAAAEEQAAAEERARRAAEQRAEAEERERRVQQEVERNEPTTPVTEPAPQPPCDLQCRGQRILAASPLSPPSGYSVTFKGAHDQLLGFTFGAPRREIVLYLRDNRTDQQMIATLLHEIGHAYDFMGLRSQGDTARQQWAEMRGFAWLGTSGWFGLTCSLCSDFDLGAGDMAESVHACWAPGYDSFRSTLAGPPTAAQCSYLRTIIG